MRNELQAALEDAIRYHELQAKSIQETLSKANYPRTIELLYEDAKGYNETAIAALRDALQRQPDPDTGLMPCGCGGKAERLKLGYQRAVACKNGHVFTGWKDTQKQADDMWNTAMGWKGGAE